MTMLRWISLFGLGGSIAGAVFLFFDVSFIDHRWTYEKVISLALISIASSGVLLCINSETRSK
jgi:hypothetical protein